MINEAFKTLHDVNYHTGSYLFHYSSFEKVTKIIFNDNLRFSNIYTLNDTTEYKPKIVFYKDTPFNGEIIERCKEINHHIKICCFTQDNDKIKRLPKKNDLYFTDYTGRGFAFPRMWAQYAANNKGVCLIINKDKMEKYISARLKIIHKGPVKYVERYNCFRFSHAAILDFKNQVLSRNTTDSIVAEKFMETYPNYVKENYFTKLTDWRDENEYRIALFSPNGETLTIGNLNDYLEGIVIGENIDNVDEQILRKLLRKNLPIKKIMFQHRSITLI